MKKMKTETKEKLYSLAECVWNEYKKEWKFIEFPAVTYMRVGQRNGVKLSIHTIKDYISIIENKIKEIEHRNDFLTGEKHVVRIIEVWSDGSVSEKTITSKKSGEETPQHVQPQQQTRVEWKGLFDYNDNKIMVRRGAHIGCNIKNPIDIFRHFGTIQTFEKWCEYQIKLGLSPDFKGKTEHGEKDLDTLNRALNNTKALYKLEKEATL